MYVVFFDMMGCSINSILHFIVAFIQLNIIFIFTQGGGRDEIRTKDKNQKQTDFLPFSYETVHLIEKFHHTSVNKLPTIEN